MAARVETPAQGRLRANASPLTADTPIRMPVKDINSYSRTAQGVILMRLQEGVKVISIARTDHEGEEIEEPVEDEIPEAGSDQGGRTEPEQ